MTTEQLAELAEALSILSAKSSVLKERDDLRQLMEENRSAEEVGVSFRRKFLSLTFLPGHPAHQTYPQYDHQD